MKNPRTARPGFTLIELLMVILIVGLLSGLLLVAVTAGVRKAQEAAIATEIENLAVAIEQFKGDKGGYPATFGPSLRQTIDDPAYGARIMRHVAKVFPRYAGDYQKFFDDVRAGTLHVNGTGLNIETLDPAESLVFWLGGLPDPNSETKLIGFRSDPSNPFRYPIDGGQPIDAPVNVESKLKSRQPSRFPFDPARLVDYDNDGWWEYHPKQKPTIAGAMAPFIYYDFNSYNNMPFYPIPPSLTSITYSDPGSVAQWGTSIPYANDATARTVSSPSFKVQWANSNKYQIIAPGRDGCYGRMLPNSVYTLSPMFPEAYKEVRLLPSCQRLVDSSDPEQLLPDTELDNQTNFTSGKLGDERP